MVTIAEISAGLGALKAAFDVAKSLNAANTQAALNEIKIVLQQHILDAQEALTAAREDKAADAERIHELEQQIMGFENWESEKGRYRLTGVDIGAFVYALKPGMDNGEPPHWLCQSCFENRKKSVLQFRGNGHQAVRRGIQSRWVCDTCKAEISVFFSINPFEPRPTAEAEPPAEIKVDYDPLGPDAH